jgi:hypothetical protein
VLHRYDGSGWPEVPSPGDIVTVHGSHGRTALRIWTGKP